MRSALTACRARYLDALVEELVALETVWPAVTVKLLLSVDRGKSVTYGSENIDIAVARYNGGRGKVCGVELGGVATAGAWADFVPLFDRARAAGLPVALHCGEDPANQAEPMEMLDWGPDRLGHCVFVDEPGLLAVAASRIPVEACIECHRRCYAVPYPNNILRTFLPRGQAVVGTDNPAFYLTNLSNEFALAAAHHGLSPRKLVELAIRGADAAFLPPDRRRALAVAMREQAESLLTEISGLSEVGPCAEGP